MSQVFRWTPFLPAAALSAALIQMPVILVGLVLDLLPAIFDSIILDLLSEGMASRLVGPFVSGLVFVYVGDRVAPRWHLYTASGLVLIWTLGSGMVFMYSLPRAGTYNSGWVELLSAVLLGIVGACLGLWRLCRVVQHIDYQSCA